MEIYELRVGYRKGKNKRRSEGKVIFVKYILQVKSYVGKGKKEKAPQ